jgi:ATP-binding cassette subfamily B protein
MSFVQENLNGIQIVQMFGREKKNMDDFDKINVKYRTEFLKTVQAFAIYFPSMNIINASAICLVLFFGTRMYINGEITVGALPAFMIYLSMFIDPIRFIANRYGSMQHAMAASERIFRLLENPDLEPDQGNYKSDSSDELIEFKHVCFGYNKDEPVLKDISISARPGERIALVGATGSGKTTTVSLLNRFYSPWSGRIHLNGVKIDEYPLATLRRLIGTVSQDLFLFSLSVSENITLGDASITRERIQTICRKIGIHDMIAGLPQGYDTLLGQEGVKLSTGQKQLIAFARVLAHNPPILVLDEATSHIDSETEHLILNAMDMLMQGRTTIAIAHRLSTLRKVDRIYVLHKGEIRERGTHRELLKINGIYAKLYELQFKKNHTDI